MTFDITFGITRDRDQNRGQQLALREPSAACRLVPVDAVEVSVGLALGVLRPLRHRPGSSALTTRHPTHTTSLRESRGGQLLGSAQSRLKSEDGAISQNQRAVSHVGRLGQRWGRSSNLGERSFTHSVILSVSPANASPAS